MKSFYTIWFAACLPFSGATAQSSILGPIVDLGYAVHQATINASGIPYYNFNNIRYGEAPTGAGRFAQPVALHKANRTLNTGQISPICPQGSSGWLQTQLNFLAGADPATLTIPRSGISALNISDIPDPATGTSEDCLFLDVLVPQSIWDRRDNGYGAPVLVWIHGGGYTVGSKGGSGNPAGLLTRSQGDGGDGIIYVAMNYRLGLYGWLSGPTFQANGTANAGFYDQLLALEWIQQNIAKFGGDPNRVTLLGESAGGGSIMHQITAFGGLKGKVPFQQAISQSPAFFPGPSNSQQEAFFQKTLQFASEISGGSITTVQQLRNLTEKQLYYVNYAVVSLSDYGTFTFGPVVDGKFVPQLPSQLLAQGRFDKSLRIMTGHNLNEGALFSSPFINNSSGFTTYLKNSFPAATEATIGYIEKTLYPAVYDGSNGYTSLFSRVSLAISEFCFVCNTRSLNSAFGPNSYNYFFTVPPGIHGSDIAYTFYNGDSSINATVARAMQNYFTEFAMTGQPNNPDAPFFPIYSSNSSSQVMGSVDYGTQIQDTGANSRCDWWQKVLYV